MVFIKAGATFLAQVREQGGEKNKTREREEQYKKERRTTCRGKENKGDRKGRGKKERKEKR